ncbi:MAG: O-antigen ligase family protein [Parcubacteria group bacterium]|nr:O-antigen ligase family protein [Parcubacteria group bacterium]
MKIPLRTLTISLFCLAAALPIVSTNALFHPQAWAQSSVFRVLTAGLVSLLLLQQLLRPFDKKALLERLGSAKIVLIPLSLFAVVLAIATLFSQDPYFSFWGTPARGWGLLNDFLLMLFAVGAFLFLSHEDWKKVWGVALAAGVGVAGIALIQTFGLLPSVFNATGLGAPGTLGSSIVLGLYLVLLAFAALALRKFPLFLFFAFAVALTLSRSSWIGFAAGIIFFLAFFPRKQVRWRAAALILLACGVLVLLIINLVALPSFVKDIPLLSPLLSRAWQDLQWENVFDLSRILAWQIELKALAEKPLLGWGPYNSSIGFNKYFDPIVTQAHARPYFDTSHNEFLDIALGSGFLGLAAYLWFIGAFLWKLQKSALENRWQARMVQAGIIGGHAALFFFPFMFSTHLLFFLLIAYGLHLSAAAPPLPMTGGGTKTELPSKKLAVFGGASLLLVSFAFFFAIQPLAWNRTLNVAAQQADRGKCSLALPAAEEVLERGKNSFFSYWIHLKYVEAVDSCIGSQEEGVQQILSEKAAAALNEELLVRPKEPRTWILLGGYFNNLAAFSKDSQERSDFLNQARTAFEKARGLSPSRYETFLEWTRTEMLSKNYEAAKQKAAQCIMLNPNSQNCWIRLSLAQFALKNTEGGLHALDKAREGNITIATTIQSEQVLIEILRQTLALPQKPYQDVVFLLSTLIDLNPNNPQYYASLAAVYLELGEYGNAGQAALAVLELQPENEEAIRQFFQQLPKEFRPDRFK